MKRLVKKRDAMAPEQRKTVTLKMVAARAGCSVSSVSTVLNNAKGNSMVSDVTRKRIFAIAKELGYHPNFASRSLRTRSTRTIGVYVQPKKWRQVGNHYELPLFKGVEKAARERNYNVMVLNLGAEVLPGVCKEQLLERRIDGIVLLHTDREIAEMLSAEHDCIVAVDCAHNSSKVNLVRFDDAAAVHLAVEHLVRLGHTRIGFAGACTAEKNNEADRERHFKEALLRNKLNVVDELIFNETKCTEPIRYEDRYCQKEGTAAIRYFHALPKPPTAVVAYNSLVASALMHEAVKLGMKLPEELSVIGIDDYEFLDFQEPRLTVIDHVLEEMGRGSAEMLIDLIEGKITPPVCRVYQPEIKEYESCTTKRSSK